MLVIALLFALDILFSMLFGRSFLIDLGVMVLFSIYLFSSLKRDKKEISKEELKKLVDEL
jgi:hypothetical protein